MRKSQVNAFRLERASKLRQIADILQREGFVDDIGPLQSAASQCASPPNLQIGNTQDWEYQVSNLIFKRISEDSLAHVRPLGAHDISIELSVDLRGVCRNSADNIANSPFVRLGIDIIARGKNVDGEEISCAWHFDKHPSSPTEAAHPEYHFQYGGRNIYNLPNYGSHLILEAPRVAHPPLDCVLAIDFILSNYFGTEWQILRTETQYRNLLSEAQKMFWLPYVLSISRICPANPPISGWDATSIWPQLIASDN